MTIAAQRILLIFPLAATVFLCAAFARGDDPPPGRDGSGPPTSPAPQTTITGEWNPRKKLADQGITFDITLTVDGSKNLRGGIDTAADAWRNLFETTLSLDTKPLLGIDGGKLFLDFQNANGQHGTNKLVGDAQKFDNIDADGRTELAQLWYQQLLLDGALRFKIGKVDANSEFEKSDNSGEFLHSSSAFSPTILFLPTYPDPATSINVFIQPGGGFYAGLGIYDGSAARGVLTGAQGPKTFFHDPRDLFLIAEIGRRWGTDPGHLPGRLAIGGWYDTNRLPRFDGGFDSGATGPYFLFDQTLYRPADADKDDPRGIAMFLNGGAADSSVALMDQHLGGGLAWTGPIPSRPRDVLGLGFNAVHFTPAAHLPSDHEISIETFFRWQVTPWASLKPDLQYIVTPGGTRRDALVATMRFVISF